MPWKCQPGSYQCRFPEALSERAKKPVFCNDVQHGMKRHTHRLTLWYSWAMPWCVQSLPNVGRICPRVSDLREMYHIHEWMVGSAFSQTSLAQTQRDAFASIAITVPGDGAVNVRNDNLIIPSPQVNGALTPTSALVLCGDTEDDIIGSFLQVQTPLGDSGQRYCTILELLHFHRHCSHNKSTVP